MVGATITINGINTKTFSFIVLLEKFFLSKYLAPICIIMHIIYLRMVDEMWASKKFRFT